MSSPVVLERWVEVIWRGASGAGRCAGSGNGASCDLAPSYFCYTARRRGGPAAKLEVERKARCHRHVVPFIRRGRLTLPVAVAHAPVVTLTEHEWRAEGRRLYGDDADAWVFVCPVCGHEQTRGDFLRLPAEALGDTDPSAVAGFSCIGRWTGGDDAFRGQHRRPCNYAGGGLFALNPQRIRLDAGGHVDYFAFARSEPA